MIGMSLTFVLLILEGKVKEVKYENVTYSNDSKTTDQTDNYEVMFANTTQNATGSTEDAILNDNPDAGNNQSISVADKRQNIIIYSNVGLGSNIIINTFVHDDRIYYIFDPLVFLKKEDIEKDAERVLMEFLQCKFTCVQNYSRKYSLPKLKLWMGKMFCSHKKSTLNTCQEKSFFTYQDWCQNRNHTAIRVIRLSTLTLLEEFMRTGVKVIHVVYDPRTVITVLLVAFKNQMNQSMNQLVKQKAILDNINTISSGLCRAMVKDIQFLWKNKQQNESWLTNYRLIHHHDMYSAPRDVIENIYQFIGLQSDEEIIDAGINQKAISLPAWSVTNNILHKVILSSVETICAKAIRLYRY